MISTQSLSVLLVFTGIFFILASLVMCIGLSKDVPDILRTKLAAMTYLVLFFTGGYIAYLLIQLWDLSFPLELVTGTVFLGGAIFVFLVMRLTSITIKRFQNIRARISEVNEALIVSNTELVTAYDSTIEGWGKTLNLRDRETEDHAQRVTEMTLRIARIYGICDKELMHVKRGALLHDIGKCGIPDAVLLKPGRYTENEFAIMKAHPAIGDNILKNMDTMVRERLMLRHHHERYDGLGYPDKLAGEDIPLEARIV